MTDRAPIQSGFIFLLYFVLRTIGFPLLVLYFLYRGQRDSRYFRGLNERLGALPPSFKRTAPGSIWLHAVSVGEVMSSIRLIEELRSANRQIPIYLSTATLAGRVLAEQKVAGLVDGIFFVPIDYAFAVRGVLRTIRPAVLVVLETEIWPVLYREAKRAGCGLIGLNGRISDRALPRYRKLKWAFAPVLALPDALFVQSETDRLRYLESGAPPDKVKVFGNLKYDAARSKAEVPGILTELLAVLKPLSIVIAASTMPGLDSTDVDEDDAVIQAFCELALTHTGLLLILVPRKPERFAIAAEKLNAAGVRFVRRSANAIPPGLKLPCVLLLDSIGELASLFPIADVVFMGGTLAKRGGHNVLEPAMCAKPIIVGPHMENFGDIAADFRSHAAWVEIPGPEALASAVELLLGDPQRRHDLGSRAAELAGRNSGVAPRAAAEILKNLDLAIPVWHANSLVRPLLWLFSKVWRAGNRAKQKRDQSRSRALACPVISVGGIGMGGAGKTPFVEMLADSLRQRGQRPAILTRGYRRRSPDKAVLIAAGEAASTWYTGDEAQIFVRSGLAHVGIGTDRWATGKLLEERFHPSVFLLDDGFQHRRLRRDLDIVLIDALNPFPGGDVFPLGRMREPLEGLARAGAFVITRAQAGRQYEGIRRVLQSANPAAPIFLSTVAALGWQPSEPAAGPVAAFCGLGNPEAFWNTLGELGYAPAFRWTFADHHRYTPRELRRLAYQARAHGARSLLTTEKDAMNLPANVSEIIAPVTLHWLKIGTALERVDELLTMVSLHKV